MTDQYHDNEGLTELCKGHTDGELLRLRVTTIRQLGRLADFLAIINEERLSRAPSDQEAVVIPLQRVSGENVVREEI